MRRASGRRSPTSTCRRCSVPGLAGLRREAKQHRGVGPARSTEHEVAPACSQITLSAAGTLPIVCPATDESDWAGFAIFDASPAEVDRIMADDPGIQAGVFTYELHPVCGFPGSALP